ncbi:hypothetical protein PC41400_14625 [Paenibacillus chitinolyticus]|uniref:Uncharacterized protein n=1 Tax=Paenibacillus chitinolyticus TaxID=79263 RepID=A0A410WX44_9BACL|nr:hypothetical protein [Paenibacillus chitinolyticus]MCY9594142.1 hypothetical protein [Paenibacillus chitinolyticus]MCY9599651.1 hypothetical protein [Paenibacillus chitinolyticus]QAV18847.1 hypothetical protein PC41400_14625 [Paenibacillus chitinolyticus]
MSSYHTAINKYGNLDVIDESRSVVISLRDATKIDTRKSQTKIFDDADDLIEFINERTAAADKMNSVYFSPRAYEIIDEHYIKLYHEMVVSFA